MGKKSIEELLNVQTELFENLQETNRHQLERVQSEAALASKFANEVDDYSLHDALQRKLSPGRRKIFLEDCRA